MPTIKAPAFADLLTQAISARDGHTLAAHFSIRDEHCRHLLDSITASCDAVESTFARLLVNYPPWAVVASEHYRVIDAYHRPNGDPIFAYEAQKKLVSAYNEYGRTSGDDSLGWTLPVMYTMNRELRALAIEADAELLRRGQKIGKQDEMARMVQMGFTACCNTRTTASDGSKYTRKVGTYYMATLLFKTYFRLNTPALCKNVVRAVDNAKILGTLSIPIAHQVTYRYYLGVMAFLREDYTQAEDHLAFAFQNSLRANKRNRELILDYLLPLKLYLHGKKLPATYLIKFSRLSEVYRPLYRAVASGDIESFDRVMSWAEYRLLARGTYLLVERCRDVCLSNLVRIVHEHQNREYQNAVENKAHQIPLKLLTKAALTPDLTNAGLSPEIEEVECVISNLIAQNRVRGYISHANQMLVLSKKKPFEHEYRFA